MNFNPKSVNRYVAYQFSPNMAESRGIGVPSTYSGSRARRVSVSPPPWKFWLGKNMPPWRRLSTRSNPRCHGGDPLS